jgi:hypothetical protein
LISYWIPTVYNIKYLPFCIQYHQYHWSVDQGLSDLHDRKKAQVLSRGRPVLIMEFHSWSRASVLIVECKELFLSMRKAYPTNDVEDQFWSWSTKSWYWASIKFVPRIMIKPKVGGREKQDARKCVISLYWTMRCNERKDQFVRRSLALRLDSIRLRTVLG